MFLSKEGGYLKGFINKYKHGWVFLYFIIYMIWFSYLESFNHRTFMSIHIPLDDYIPFNEWFVIPYLLWFIFVAITVLYFFFNSKEEFYKYFAFLAIGMTTCLVIYTLWPNQQNLRPNLSTMGRDNILMRIVSLIYTFDTPTNVCPSIHVYNSLGTLIAISKNSRLRHSSLLYLLSFILTVSICLSTMFIKQHSAFDTICAIALAMIVYVIVYFFAARSSNKKHAGETLKENLHAN